jgi:hypothetical protein
MSGLRIRGGLPPSKPSLRVSKSLVGGAAGQDPADPCLAKREEAG